MVYWEVIRSLVLYGSETQVLDMPMLKNVERSHMVFYRGIVRMWPRIANKGFCSKSHSTYIIRSLQIKIIGTYIWTWNKTVAGLVSMSWKNPNGRISDRRWMNEMDMVVSLNRSSTLFQCLKVEHWSLSRIWRWPITRHTISMIFFYFIHIRLEPIRIKLSRKY